VMPFIRADEVRAFDLWRRWADASTGGPQIWKDALHFWKDDAATIDDALAARLADHPLDALSARAALRLPAPASSKLALRAIRALGDLPSYSGVTTDADEQLLRFRFARSLLARPVAARDILTSTSPEGLAFDLVRRRFRAADIDGALADFARLAFANEDHARVNSALRILAERKWAGARALRAEFSNAAIDAPAVAQRIVNGEARLYRPRDLSFALVSEIVASDLSKRAQARAPEARP